MKEKMTDKDERKSALLFLLVFFLLSILSACLSIAWFAELRTPIINANFLWLSILLSLLFVSGFVLCSWFVLSGRETFVKSAITFYILLSFSVSVCFILQKTGFFEVVKSPERLQEYLEKSGALMPIFYTVLQFLQVVVLPIPSIVSTVAGVALFGAFKTTVYSLIGILLGSFLAFFIGRKWGNRAVSWIVGEDTLKKWQRKLKGKDNLFLTAMFLLPLFPDDILCFLAGISSMSTKYFLTVITLSRILAITATCYSFDFIPFNTWWGIMLWVIFFVGIILLFILVYKNMDKIQNALKARKKKKK